MASTRRFRASWKASTSLDRGAEPRQCLAQGLVLDLGQRFRDLGDRFGIRRLHGAARLRPRQRRTGAARSCRPRSSRKSGSPRCRIASDECWISSAIGPSTRRISVAGSCGWPSTGARPLDLQGLRESRYLLAGDFGPAPSPARAKQSPVWHRHRQTPRPSRTESGFARDIAGLVHGRAFWMHGRHESISRRRPTKETFRTG